ncbi:MAG: DUF445 domain-containing protein [Flammeovirgaceae bacterium]
MLLAEITLADILGNAQYATPIFAGAIGWITNYFAIKMLFRPRIEQNFYLFKLQGVFPKRQEELGYRLGRVVSRELFSMSEIKEKVDNDEVRGQLKLAIVRELEAYLIEYTQNNKLVSMFVNDKMIDNIKGKVNEKLDDMIPKMLEQFSTKLEEIDIEMIVAEKIHNFSHEKLENLLMSIIKKELKMIEILGGVLGLIVGFLQLGLILLGDMYQ